jgi:hypothetical protein
MPIVFRCPGCASTLEVEALFAGRKIRCGKCQAVVPVPDATDDAAAAVQPSPSPPPRRARFEDEDDARRPPPRRRAAREPANSGAFPILLVVGLVGGGVLLLGCILGGVVLVALTASSPSPSDIGPVGGPRERDQPPPQKVVRKSALDLKDVGEFKAPARAAAPTSYLRIASGKGDFVGQGNGRVFRGEEMKASNQRGGIRVEAGGWHVEFGAPRGLPLEANHYPNAKRFGFHDDSPGIDFSGQGMGFNRIKGSFVVWEIETREGRVTKLAIDFIQFGEERPPPLTGSVRFNSSLE